MPQIITPPLAGHELGFTAGSNTRVKLLVGSGDPNTSSTDSSAGDLATAGVGSLYLRNDAPDINHALYVKTALGTVSNPTGTWTPK
ncbi:MAG TPA: hypothetical protein VJ731_01230 [Terriglobales bacterium]|nr:hypothetical protein [Terriglobales bacterium]